MTEYFATCAGGLEQILAQELKAIGADNVQPGRGGVDFAGDRAMLYRANLCLRTAIRVLVPILRVAAMSPEDLYEAVQTVDWSQYLTPEHTLAVDANVRSSQITHSRYAAHKVKDAICDQQMDQFSRRSSIDADEPMVGLNLHLYQDEAILSLDSTGHTLHKRGYRPILTRAPLNEALASALVLMTGYHGEVPFVDPLCGSGTLCIEAAWIALNRPPGLTRRRFGFMGWMDYDVKLWTQVRDHARGQVKPRLEHPILGYDIRGDAVSFAGTNARAAGIGHALRFEVKDVAKFQPPPGPAGVILCNPPYGERLGEEKELGPLYRTLGKVFGRLAPCWRVFVFTGNAALASQIDLPVRGKTHLFNGKIPCQLLEYGEPRV